MKRFFGQLCLFIAVSLPAYVVLLLLCGHLLPDGALRNLHKKWENYGYTRQRMKEAGAYQEVDILFIGSSHIYRGFDTRFFNEKGLKTFNFGSSAQTFLQTEMLLDHYLNTMNPRLVVLDVAWGRFISDGVESTMDFLHNSSFTPELHCMLLRQGNIRAWNTWAYLFFRRMVNAEMPDIWYEDDIYIPGGYVEKDYTTWPPHKVPKDAHHMTLVQQRAFQRIMNRLQQEQVPVMLIRTPVSRAAYGRWMHEDEFDAFLMPYGGYYDFNGMVELDDARHFYDPLHMNQEGVVLFNKVFFKVLENGHFFNSGNELE